jgi:hypothetical protein
VSGVGHLFIKAALLSCAGHPNLIYVTIVYRCVPVGWQLVEELKGDEALRKALSDELLVEALSRKEWRRAVLLAVAREVATGDDIRELRSDVNSNIRELREYIDASIRELRAYVDSRFDRLNSRIDVLLVTVAVTLATAILRVLSGA